MRFANYEEPKEKKQFEDVLIKNKECATCENMCTCKGKPRSVTQCINYKERKKEN